MSKIFEISLSDFVKGSFIFVASAVLTTCIAMLQGQQTIDLKQVCLTAAIAFMSYLLKQLGTDENGKFIGKI